MKKILILILLAFSMGVNAQTTIGAIVGASGFYTGYGISYINQTGQDIGIYSDLKFSKYDGEVGQTYRHTTGHVGVVYDWSKLVRPYVGIGLHNEHITADTRSWDLNAFSTTAGILIGTKDNLIGWQQGFELDFQKGWGVGVNIVFGLTFNF